MPDELKHGRVEGHAEDFPTELGAKGWIWFLIWMVEMKPGAVDDHAKKRKKRCDREFC
jgi:hypothetical protein